LHPLFARGISKALQKAAKLSFLKKVKVFFGSSKKVLTFATRFGKEAKFIERLEEQSTSKYRF